MIRHGTGILKRVKQSKNMLIKASVLIFQYLKNKCIYYVTTLQNALETADFLSALDRIDRKSKYPYCAPSCKVNYYIYSATYLLFYSQF